MDDDDPAKPLDKLMEPGSTVMFGLASGATGIEFRPLTVARVDGDRIEILLDTREAWVAAMNDGDCAEVTLSDTRTNTWASLHGTASITTDQQLIEEL
jgi:general stress protein 26